MIWHPELSIILTDGIPESCTIHAPVWIGRHVLIGERTKVQAFAFIPEGVRIGADCFIGPHVCFTNDRHPPSVDWEETVVEDSVSIGAGTAILPGLVIHRGAKIGAGSLILHDVPPQATVHGKW